MERRALVRAGILLVASVSGCASLPTRMPTSAPTSEVTTPSVSAECDSLPDESLRMDIRNHRTSTVEVAVTVTDGDASLVDTETTLAPRGTDGDIEHLRSVVAEPGTYRVSVSTQDLSTSYEWIVGDACDGLQVHVAADHLNIHKFGRE